jgi:flagellar biosynthesis GTPase FlhF
MSAMDGSRDADEKPKDGLVAFLLENRTLVNFASIIMLVFAVWATVEVITNSLGMTWWPPETGIPSEDIYNNPDDLNNINNGWIIGLGAVCGTVGFMIQYFYRAAPHVDASMKATAALIISAVKEDEIQESAEKMAKEIVAAEKEEAEAEAEAEAQAEAEAEAEAEDEAEDEVNSEDVSAEMPEAEEVAEEPVEEDNTDAQEPEGDEGDSDESASAPTDGGAKKF